MGTHDVRAELAHEIGCKVEDMLDAAKLEVVRDEGHAAALYAATREMVGVIQLVDKDLDAGAFSEVSEPLQVASAVKKYLGQAISLLEAGAKKADDHRWICQGRVQALDLVVGNMKKIHNLERVQAQQHADPSTPQAVVAVPSIAPSLPLRERRRLEEVAEAAAKSAPPEALPVPQEKITKPRRSKRA